MRYPPSRNPNPTLPNRTPKIPAQHQHPQTNPTKCLQPPDQINRTNTKNPIHTPSITHPIPASILLYPITPLNHSPPSHLISSTFSTSFLNTIFYFTLQYNPLHKYHHTYPKITAMRNTASHEPSWKICESNRWELVTHHSFNEKRAIYPSIHILSQRNINCYPTLPYPHYCIDMRSPIVHLQYLVSILACVRSVPFQSPYLPFLSGK